MQTARFNAPVILLKNQFVIVAGGQTNLENLLNMATATEIYDTQLNRWYNLAPLLRARASTSMTQIADQHVFIINGLEGDSTMNHAIEYMDLGECDQNSFNQAYWRPIIINSERFHLERPRASAPLGNFEILVFGGSGNFTYLLDLRYMLRAEGNDLVNIGTNVNISRL